MQRSDHEAASSWGRAANRLTLGYTWNDLIWSNFDHAHYIFISYIYIYIYIIRRPLPTAGGAHQLSNASRCAHGWKLGLGLLQLTFVCTVSCFQSVFFRYLNFRFMPLLHSPAHPPRCQRTSTQISCTDQLRWHNDIWCRRWHTSTQLCETNHACTRKLILIDQSQPHCHEQCGIRKLY